MSPDDLYGQPSLGITTMRKESTKCYDSADEGVKGRLILLLNSGLAANA